MGSRKRAKQNPTAESSTPHLSPAMSSLASLSAKAASKSSKLQTPATEEPPATPTTATPSVPGTPRSSKAVASNGDATPSAKQACNIQPPSFPSSTKPLQQKS
ncbi:uncharacterized protein CTHT_0026800 [Thermochaetoides thermophila DSM 1495]|uniref:Uncharacterized protein n=1 Tax=Chaetomium thermophilum (strain DSM 1495 / CBS 144.50 / IMI 039719) TaxID=759272 RepID=G0S6T4_CHATD|nr:hypothetical protein CTHT_0026800 [Thermochaetoides thermophila DSM 1495]EGS20842.1 hypothetical protein CTHT_0026800 [Thermochaetoides thermophila DSM 1495]